MDQRSQEAERADHWPKTRISKKVPYGESIADPTAIGTALDALKFLDGFSGYYSQ
ncbi:hypothetical protein [Nitrosospira briensis]|uniref:hypothetical protein n=1 Tax=Nitrosospira briensis TaxID=35799 RepID=UPI003527B74C